MWLYLPKLTSASSATPVASTLPSDSLYRPLAASAMWRSSFRQPRFWQRALRKVPWTRLLSGLTSEPSHADSTVAAWLEQFSVSPARTSLSQASKKDLSKAPAAGCSSAPCESFARLDASGAFLKTSLPFSLFQQDMPFSENLPKAGSMRSGFLFERPMLELRTDGSGYSSWPTARAEDSECCGNHPGAQESLGGGRRHMDQLSNQVEHSFLPAPQTESNGQPSSASAPTSRRRLNAKFVEWLQGLPEGWTSPDPISSEALETWLSHSRAHLRSLFSSIGR